MNSTVKKETRWYVVSNKSDGGRCLVEASNRAQAFRRAAEHYCRAEPATVADTIDMIRHECDVISAPATPEQMDIEYVIGEAGSKPISGTSAATICGHPECDNDSVLGKCERTPAISRAADVFANLPSGEPDEK